MYPPFLEFLKTLTTNNTLPVWTRKSPDYPWEILNFKEPYVLNPTHNYHVGYVINNTPIPNPLVAIEKNKEVYIPYLCQGGSSGALRYMDTTYDRTLLEDKLLYRTAEEAEIVAKALLIPLQKQPQE